MKRILPFALLLCFLGCKTNRISNGRRVGLWIERDTIAEKVYTSRGRYRNGIETGRWKYLADGKKTKTEKYKDSIAHTVFYHENGKKMYEGKTRLQQDAKYQHWYYFGPWRRYDENENLIETVLYENGKIVQPIEAD